MLSFCSHFARKPYLLTYLHELAATVISLPIACGPQLWPRCQALGLRAMAMGLLAFVANVAFMAALVLTTASSAMTLEQLTPVFIAALSCAFLKERYKAGGEGLPKSLLDAYCIQY